MQWTCKLCKMHTGSDLAQYRSHFTYVCDLGCVSGSAKAHSRECHHHHTHPQRHSCSCPFPLTISICTLMIEVLAQTCLRSGVRGREDVSVFACLIMQHLRNRGGSIWLGRACVLGDGYGIRPCVVRSIMQHHRQRIMMIEILARRCVCSG